MENSPPPRFKRRGRPATITREAIEWAVVEVGFDRASTTSVAARLGVDQSSLYRHVESKGAMLLGAVERVLGTLDWDLEAGSWDSYLRALGDSLWTLFRAHPGLCSEMYKVNDLTPTSRRLTATAVGRLVAFGWSVPDAMLVLDTVFDMAADYVFSLETRVDRSALVRIVQDAPPPEDEIEREVFDYFLSFLEADPKDWWERKLELVIAGADRLRAPGAGA